MRTPKKQAEEPAGFRVLIAVHRPRYRVRAERATEVEGWRVCSLLNKEDVVGLVNQKPPNVLVMSDDFGRQKALGIFHAVQRYRESGMKIVGLFEDTESAESASALCDATLAPPWRTMDLRGVLSGFAAVRPTKDP